MIVVAIIAVGGAALAFGSRLGNTQATPAATQAATDPVVHGNEVTTLCFRYMRERRPACLDMPVDGPRPMVQDWDVQLRRAFPGLPADYGCRVPGGSSEVCACPCVLHVHAFVCVD